MQLLTCTPVTARSEGKNTTLNFIPVIPQDDHLNLVYTRSHVNLCLDRHRDDTQGRSTIPAVSQRNVQGCSQVENVPVPQQLKEIALPSPTPIAPRCRKTVTCQHLQHLRPCLPTLSLIYIPTAECGKEINFLWSCLSFFPMLFSTAHLWGNITLLNKREGIPFSQ